MLVGYARISTVDQHGELDAQLHRLRAAGCGEVFYERASLIAERPQFAAAVDFARQGDVFLVTKPDRLARSTAELLGIIGWLETKGVSLVILTMGEQQIDTRTAAGKLMLLMLIAVSAFEQDLAMERQREGLAMPRVEGKDQGRARTIMQQAKEIRRLRDEGVTAAEIAGRLGIAKISVYRALSATAASVTRPYSRSSRA